MAEKEFLFSVTIKDCVVQTFRCPGHGGQNVNKVESGVRIIHEPSGAIAKSCDTRDQLRNKRIAWERLANDPKFRTWIKLEASRRTGQPTAEEVVDKMMAPANLRVDVKDENGRWITEECTKSDLIH
jgi:protein subunit release factor B